MTNVVRYFSILCILEVVREMVNDLLYYLPVHK